MTHLICILMIVLVTAFAAEGGENKTPEADAQTETLFQENSQTTGGVVVDCEGGPIDN